MENVENSENLKSDEDIREEIMSEIIEDFEISVHELEEALDEYIQMGGTSIEDLKEELNINEPLRIPYEKNTVHFSRRKTGDKEYEVIAKVRQKPEGVFYSEGDFHGSWITLEVHKNHDDAISAIKRLRA